MRTKDETKIASIFKATLELVKARGLAGITMSDISKAASIATGTLYIYFKNKDDLIKELFVQCRVQSAEKYFAGLDAATPFEERMRLVFGNIIHYKMKFFEVSAFLEQSYHSPFVCSADLKRLDKVLHPLLDLIEEGIREKKIKDVPVQLILSYIFGTVNELVKKAYFAKRKIDAATIDTLYSMYWDGIKYNG